MIISKPPICPDPQENRTSYTALRFKTKHFSETKQFQKETLSPCKFEKTAEIAYYPIDGKKYVSITTELGNVYLAYNKNMEVENFDVNCGDFLIEMRPANVNYYDTEKEVAPEEIKYIDVDKVWLRMKAMLPKCSVPRDTLIKQAVFRTKCGKYE